MIGIIVGDVASRAVRRDDDQRNTGAVAEEVQRLHVAGIVVAATLIFGDEDSSFFPQFRVGLHGVNDLLSETFEQIQLGRRWVTIDQSAGLDDGDSRQC